MEKLPVAYLHEIKEQLGEEFEEYLQSFFCPVQCALRINTAKITPGAYQTISPWNLKPVPWITNGFYYEDACTPAKHLITMQVFITCRNPVP